MKIRFVSIPLSLLFCWGALAQDVPLKTGVDGTFAPHAMPSVKGGVEGYNIDLAQELARRLGRKIEIEATQFSGLVPGLQSGRYDFIGAPVTVTKERAESLLFTEGYINTDFQFVTKKDAADVKALEDLKGKTIAVNKGSTYDIWARDMIGKIGWSVDSFGSTTDAVQAVVSGRAHALIAGNTAAAWAVQKSPPLKLSYLRSTGLVFAVPVRKDNVALRNQLDAAIECMKKDGFLTRLHEKWFGYKPAADSASVVVFPGAGVPGLPGYDPNATAGSCS